MKVVTFNEIKNELINNFRRQMLIPVVGSGFTRNCKSYNGRVPSGEDYRHYMIAQIVEVLHLTENEESELHATSFSGISTIYHKSVPQNAQTNYLKNNFYKVARGGLLDITSPSNNSYFIQLVTDSLIIRIVFIQFFLVLFEINEQLLHYIAC